MSKRSGKNNMDKILRSALAAITAVNEQVYPLVADESATGSYIVYEQTKNTPLNTLSGATNCFTVDYDVHLLAEKYAEIQELTTLVCPALLAIGGTKTTDGVFVQSVDITDQKPQEWNQNIGVYRATVSISCFVSVNS